MRQRLLLIVALAVMAAATVGGSVSAAPSIVGTGQDGVSITLPDGADLNVLPACKNGQDDDGDGAPDYHKDPGCTGLTDNDESNPPPGGTTTKTPGTTTTTPGTT